jgi:hypothetical protein
LPELPATAAWRHEHAREGFEVVFPRRSPDGFRFDGHVVAVEEGEAWSVSYTIELDAAWRTRVAEIASRSATGERRVRLEGDGRGAWRADGRAVDHVEGCLDVDLEASVVTNAFPARRLELGIGEPAADAPAVFVRAVGLEIERLEQRYERLPDEASEARYRYEAPRFGYADELVYCPDGLVRLYPGIASRVL